MPEPVDQAHRHRAVTEHGSSLFVDAGAGSGKTKTMVDRIVALVLAGSEITSLAAITFTEAAAAELRTRLRDEMEDRWRSAQREERALLRRALDQLDDAAILTLHAFAQRILSQHPVEAGLPPEIEIEDEVRSTLTFQDRWRTLVRDILDDPAMSQIVRFSLDLGCPPSAFEVVARSLNDNWDLIADLQARGELDPTPPTVRVDGSAAIAAAEEVLRLREGCTDDSDKLAGEIDEHVRPWVADARSAHDEHHLLRVLRSVKRPRRGGGNKDLWPDKDAIHASLDAWTAACETAVSAVSDPVVRAIAVRVALDVLRAADRRNERGRLQFHDLLVLARRLVRHEVSVRKQLHDRYQHLLIDEFQDTDPIQAELAVRIAADEHHPAEHPWQEIPVPPGRLFVVGDAKQSIYRFRRADVELFTTVQGLLTDRVELSVNFRSTREIIDVVNAVFSAAMVGQAGQVEFAPLTAFREHPPTGSGPAVLRFGEASDGYAEELRMAEAADTARVIVQVLDEGWQVRDERTEEWRVAQPSDIAVLLPARTSLGHLEDALAERGLPYRVETGTLLYGTDEISGLVNVLGAVADPGDEIAVVGALRSAAYACGDDDLYVWKAGGGSWNPLAPAPTDHADGPVGQAMADLRSRHDRHHWQTVPEIVESVIRERRLMETAVQAPERRREGWRRYRVVLEHAREHADAGAGHLRSFLDWVELQSSDAIRPSVRMLPEADLHAVRILTIHGAKGLEFPVTVVSGLTRGEGRRAQGPQVLLEDGGFEAKISGANRTAYFDAARAVEDQMDEAERIRLLYVALTRASDHLIVSTHHRPGKQNPDRITSPGHRLHQLLEPMSAVAVFDSERPDGPWSGCGASTSGSAHDAERFAETIAAVESRSAGFNNPAGGGAIAATGVARLLAEAGAAAGPDVEEVAELTGGPDRPPWRRGRAGTAIGRATHNVLQHVRLDDADDPDLQALVDHQVAIEGVTAAAGEVADRVRHALGSDLVREAAASRHWREVHVAAEVEGTLLEGFIDLMHEGTDGLVITDYKTDGVSGASEVADALTRYTPQGAAYAVAVEAATGRNVSKVVFLFCGPRGSTTAEITDLDAEKQRVRAALAGAPS